MRAEQRVLLLAGILLATVPSWAGACEQRLDATATAWATASACTEPVTTASACTGSAVAIAKTPTASRAAKKTRRHWAPGHLVEPDSMRLVPQDRAPGEEWVIISSRTGAIQVRRTPWAPKKSEGRNLSQNPPHHS